MASYDYCGYIAISNNICEYGRFRYTGTRIDSKNLESRIYPYYDILKNYNSEKDIQFTEGPYGDLIGSLSYNEYIEKEKSQILNISEETNTNAPLYSIQNKKTFLSSLFNCTFLKKCAIYILFYTATNSENELDIKSFLEKERRDNVILLPGIYQSIPCEAIYFSTNRNQLVFKVNGSHITIYTLSTTDANIGYCSQQHDFSFETFCKKIYSLIDKNQTMDKRLLLTNDECMAMRPLLEKEFNNWDKTTKSSLEWYVKGNRRSIACSDNIYIYVKLQMLEDIIKEEIESLHLNLSSIQSYSVNGESSLANFIKTSFQDLFDTIALYTYNIHETMCSNLFEIFQRIEEKAISSENIVIQRNLLKHMMKQAFLPSSLTSWNDLITKSDCKGYVSINTPSYIIYNCYNKNKEVIRLQITDSTQGSCNFIKPITSLFPSYIEDKIKNLNLSYFSLGKIRNDNYDDICVFNFYCIHYIIITTMEQGMLVGPNQIYYKGQLIFKGTYYSDKLYGPCTCYTYNKGTYGDNDDQTSIDENESNAVNDDYNLYNYFKHSLNWFHFINNDNEVTSSMVKNGSWQDELLHFLHESSLLIHQNDDKKIIEKCLHVNQIVTRNEGYIKDNTFIQNEDINEEKCDPISSNHHSDQNAINVSNVSNDSNNSNNTTDTTDTTDTNATTDGSSQSKNYENDQMDMGMTTKQKQEQLCKQLFNQLYWGEDDEEENAWLVDMEDKLNKDDDGISNYPIEEEEIKEVTIEQPEENVYMIEKGVSLQRNKDWHIQWDNQASKGTGEGSLLSEDNKLIYKGNFVKYELCGNGTLFYKTGKKQYEGKFEHNVLNGQGKWYYPNSCLHYDGMWKEGKREGEGNEFRFVNLNCCNNAARSYLLTKGINSEYVSVQDSIDPYTVFESNT